MKTLTFKCNESIANEKRASVLMEVLKNRANHIVKSKRAEMVVFEFPSGSRWQFQFDANGEAIGGTITTGSLINGE